MLSPGGAFLRDVAGVFIPPSEPGPGISFALSIGASPGFAVCCNLNSMMCLCCSRTEMLRCSCSRIVGSCVTKPGERHAKPTSWIPSAPLSLEVSGPVPLEVEFAALELFLERSSFRGRCRDVGRPGDVGSFLTIILGGTPFRRAVGELFDAAGPLGLPLPDLCACRFGVAEADTRVSRGEELDADGAEGAMSTYELRSWGAGDGAIAMAVLMMMMCYGEE